MLGHSFLFVGLGFIPLRRSRDVILSDAIKIQSFELVRDSASGSFDPRDVLSATLVVIDLDDLVREVREALIVQLLHDDELARRASFKHTQRKDSYTHGRLAAKVALQAHRSEIDPRLISIESGIFEQPILSNVVDANASTLGVSISHSDRRAAALVFHRGHPMGIDVDLLSEDDVGPVFDGLDHETREMCATIGLSKGGTASLLWVARESLAKTLTTGMMTPLDIYAPSEISRKGDVYVLGYRNFAQYQTYVWSGGSGWLAMTLPARTRFKNERPEWS